MIEDRTPRVWALLTHRRGDNNQVLALAQALGWPFETRTIKGNWLRKLPKRLLRDRLISIGADERRWLKPPWPDVVIAMGHRTVPVVRHIRKLSSGTTKLVHLGNPRLPSRHFDLVITMPQYGRQDGANLLRLPIAMGGAQRDEQPVAAEQTFLKNLPRPHRLMILGGRAKLWRLSQRDMLETARTLIDRCERDGGTLVIIGSPRTPPGLLAGLDGIVESTRHQLVHGQSPRYRTLLNDADELFVTADSVSMVSDAILTRKPVGMIPITPKLQGRVRYALADAGLTGAPPHDLRNFWRILSENGLVGTVDQPCAAQIDDPVHVAAAAVRQILGMQKEREEAPASAPIKPKVTTQTTIGCA